MNELIVSISEWGILSSIFAYSCCVLWYLLLQSDVCSQWFPKTIDLSIWWGKHFKVSNVSRVWAYLIRFFQILDNWRSYKSTVPTYGGILMDSSLNHILLVQGFYASKNSWGFPKGKVSIRIFIFEWIERFRFENIVWSRNSIVGESDGNSSYVCNKRSIGRDRIRFRRTFRWKRIQNSSENLILFQWNIVLFVENGERHDDSIVHRQRCSHGL